MARYDFVCPECGFKKEIICSMSEISDKMVPCDRCLANEVATKKHPQLVTQLMKRVYTNPEVIFKGNFPSKDVKRAGEDSDVQRQRRKAWLLKHRGDVPSDHVIGLKEADSRFDKKYRDSDLDKQYDKAIKEENK
jgi:predicted nucleic acid-binding Zn ribbon protein